MAVIHLISFLTGSGFALSDASKISGLSKWLGHQLSALQVLPPFSILIICCMLTTWMTEIVSNTATANIVLPILAQMADTIHVNPLYLMIPAAATYASFTLQRVDFSSFIDNLIYQIVAATRSSFLLELRLMPSSTTAPG